MKLITMQKLKGMKQLKPKIASSQPCHNRITDHCILFFPVLFFFLLRES